MQATSLEYLLFCTFFNRAENDTAGESRGDSYMAGEAVFIWMVIDTHT